MAINDKIAYVPFLIKTDKISLFIFKVTLASNNMKLNFASDNVKLTFSNTPNF